MKRELLLPRLGETMEQGTVVSWVVGVGERFQRGDVLLELETDKMVAEIPALEDGTLLEIVAHEQAQVQVGQVLAHIEVSGESTAQAPSLTTPALEAREEEPADRLPTPPHRIAAQQAAPLWRRARPAARRFAQREQIRIDDLPGSGPLGRVELEDVQRVRASRSAPTLLSSGASLLLEVGRHQVHVRRRGPHGKNPLLLLHGFTSELSAWGYHAQALAAEREVIALDFPGHGGSSALSNACALSELADVVVKLVPRLGVAQVHLVGHSLGGGVALAMADQAPALFSRLTLLAPLGLESARNRPLLRELAQATPEANWPLLLSRLVYDTDWVTPELIRSRQAQAADPARRRSREWLLPTVSEGWDGYAALASLAMPVRLLWGLQDQLLLPPHWDNVPGWVAQHRLPQVGHLPQVESASLLLRLLREDNP
jgi:pyruvate dehydrogenase E2 component (dihydrolipoamide acetyltransferase)